ncbi:hypothetical protein [Flavobacterium sp. 5]|uniref:hypothetical protein n=1 Tax=Flavobacterium sp. 5 TaxID=2035199 RepID=UPI000C2B5EC2|nr:hypothetical protein [Flavobacterium sp. 5]PKB16806.1 hypothetical protein CLU82_1955 [Flavobacterium sp. 5]
MNQFEATFTDISNWHKNEFYSTGGTRSKYITLEPETNNEYFFKGSKETIEGEIRYPTEFWSEIISSKIGQFLGFPMLDYNIGYDENHNQKVGCLSKSMVDNSVNQLIEGKRYLTGYDEKYNAGIDKDRYTFQFIKGALIQSDLENCINNIIEVIVFDSIIGNSDRHQENWGIIIDYSYVKDVFNDAIHKKDKRLRGYFKNLKRIFKAELLRRAINEKMTDVLATVINSSFAPIYDSGCCLGREHTDEKILKILNDSQMIDAYIRKGESEIHWEGSLKKRKHLELVTLLLQEYPNETEKYISRVQEKYQPEVLKELINNIDKHVPENLINFKLSETRKQLMYKLVTLRIEKLIQLL